MSLEVIIAAVVVMLASLAGVVFVHRIAREFLEERLSYLVAFSAGVFSVTAGVLALEVFELLSWSMAGLYLVCGYGAAWLLHALLPETHHHHDPSCGHMHGGARKLLVGDGVHNIADGIVLVSAFAVSPILGVAATVSIFIHEALQEISEFFVLRQAGFSTARALLFNFLVSSTIFIGVALGSLALATHELEGVLLALSAGFFAHVVVHDLFPRRASHNATSRYIEHIILVGLGIVAMVSIGVLAGQSHEHGDELPHTDAEMHEEHSMEEEYHE